jgi:hypothetical protein
MIDAGFAAYAHRFYACTAPPRPGRQKRSAVAPSVPLSSQKAQSLGRSATLPRSAPPGHAGLQKAHRALHHSLYALTSAALTVQPGVSIQMSGRLRVDSPLS